MADGKQMPEDISSMSFEEAMAALENIVSRLETGNAPLEDSIDLYTRGTFLKQHCEAKLRDAEQKIAKISLGADGSVGAEDLDLE